MLLRSKLRLPKEHGAWAMLYVPYLLGAVAAGRDAGRQVLLGLAITFVFIGRESLLVWWRARARGREDDSALRLLLVYLSLSAVSAVPLLFLHRLYGVIPLGLLAGGLLVWNVRQASKREERTMATEIVGIGGLTLTAPAAHYVGLGKLTPDALWIWAFSALYFIGSVFYVRLRVLAAHSRRPEDLARIRRDCAIYHAALIGGLAGMMAAGQIHPFFVAAFAPALVRAAWHVIRPTTELALTRVGIQEIVYSLYFLVVTAAACRESGSIP